VVSWLYRAARAIHESWALFCSPQHAISCSCVSATSGQNRKLKKESEWLMNEGPKSPKEGLRDPERDSERKLRKCRVYSVIRIHVLRTVVSRVIASTARACAWTLEHSRGRAHRIQRACPMREPPAHKILVDGSEHLGADAFVRLSEPHCQRR
jgi:hypothetical protein